MRGSWGRYLPASWTHASVHPDLFTTECLLYLRDGECATRRSLKSGRAVPQQAPRFGAAKCRNVTLPYFQLCSIESRFCRVGICAPHPVRVFAMASHYRAVGSLPKKNVTSLGQGLRVIKRLPPVRNYVTPFGTAHAKIRPCLKP